MEADRYLFLSLPNIHYELSMYSVLPYGQYVLIIYFTSVVMQDSESSTSN